jgi:ParB family transcriptional regulator, chromosome partitioning protein
MQRKALGRGLAQLLGETTTDSKSKFNFISLDSIEVGDQPRKNFDEESLRELSESIKQVGILQPLLVVRHNNGYKLIAGERRWKAAKIAGLQEVPVIILDNSSELNLRAIQLIENLQRQDLNPIEEAKAFQDLIKNHSLTHEKLAEILGKSRAYVSNALRLLNLEASVLELVAKGLISVGHAKVLVSVSNSMAQKSLAKKILSAGLSVRELEEIVKRSLPLDRGLLVRSARKSLSSKEEELLQQISKVIGKKVALKGKVLKIYLKSSEDLEDLAQALTRQTKYQ